LQLDAQRGERFAKENTNILAGNFCLNDSMPLAASRAKVGDIRLKVGQNVCQHDSATIPDATDST